MGIIKTVPIKKFIKGKYYDKTDLIIEEKAIDIIINKHRISTRLLPENIEYFIHGYLLTNFFIENIDDVENLNISENEIEVKLKKEIKQSKKINLVSSCFSSEEVFSDMSGIKGDFKVDPQIIIENTSKFLKQGKYFSKTGGTHLAALFKGNKLIVCFEDIGRHNAIDKVIGFIL